MPEGSIKVNISFYYIPENKHRKCLNVITISYLLLESLSKEDMIITNAISVSTKGGEVIKDLLPSFTSNGL